MRPTVTDVVRELADAHFAGAVFNPWSDVDGENGRGDCGPAIRRRQLRHYFEARRERAGWVLVGEAMGYQGGHFSGVPMTSERILLGHMSDRGISAAGALPDLTPERTSRADIKPKGFSEPTATVVWGAIRDLGVDPLAVTLWNTFAWHPFRPERGLLSNRRPTAEELANGMPALRSVLRLFPRTQLVAVGKVAAAALESEGYAFSEVRHPAHGGAPLFREQMRRLIGDESETGRGSDGGSHKFI